MKGVAMGSTDAHNSLSDTPFEERPRICQAQGCEVNVNPYGRYCKKRRLCPEHLKAPSLRRKKYGDEKWRFCQQCGKLELIKNFDGLKRSCRVQLARRRAANNTKGERRRSYTTEPSRSTDNRSSSVGGSMSQEEAQAGAGDHASSGADAAENFSQDPSAAASLARHVLTNGDTARGAAAAAAASGRLPPAAVQTNHAGFGPGGGYNAELHGLELPGNLPGNLLLGVHSTAQFGLDQASFLNAPASQPLLAGQEHGQQHPGLFGLQQQQQQQQQHQVQLSLLEQLAEQQQQQQQQPAQGGPQPAAARGAAAGLCSPLPNFSAAMAASTAVQSTTGDLLRQLLREQQRRGWQQLQPNGFPQAPAAHSHQDIYTLALDAACDSTGAGFASSGDLGLMGLSGQQQQVQPQQHSLCQAPLQPQQQLLEESLSVTGAVTRSGSSGGLPVSGSATEAASMLGFGMGASGMAYAKPEQATAPHLQFVPSSFAEAMPRPSYSMLQRDSSNGRSAASTLAAQQQQQFVGQTSGSFHDPVPQTVSNNQPGWVQANGLGPCLDYQGLDELLAAASDLPGHIQAAQAAIAQDRQALAASVRSLSAADAQQFGDLAGVSRAQQQQQLQQQQLQQQRTLLRAYDSAPSQLRHSDALADNAAAAAAAGMGGTYNSLGSLQGSSVASLSGQGMTHRGSLQMSSAAPAGALGGTPGTYAAAAAAGSGLGGPAAPLMGSWSTDLAMQALPDTAARQFGQQQQQQQTGRRAQGLWEPSSGFGTQQDLAAELQAMLDSGAAGASYHPAIEQSLPPVSFASSLQSQHQQNLH